MATQYCVLLDENNEPTEVYTFDGGYKYLNRDSFTLLAVLDQVEENDNNFYPSPIIDPDTNTVIPPPNTTGGAWADPTPGADTTGEWVDNPTEPIISTQDITFYGLSQKYVIVNATQTVYTDSDVVTWAKQVTLWWLWDTHKKYVDIWHSLISPTLTLLDLDDDYDLQYNNAQNATTIAELQAITLIYPY